METIRYRPVKDIFPEREDREYFIDLGMLDEATCKSLYLGGRINDDWDIRIHIPDEDTLIEKPSTLWTK